MHRAVTREVVSSRLRPDQHSGSLNNFLVSDKDAKSEVPSHNSLNVDNSVGRKRTHALFEKSRVIPVLWLSFVCEWGEGVG